MQSLIAGPSSNHAESSANGKSSHTQSLKRKASHAKLSPPPSALASTSTARTLFTTPKKKAYSGPIIDPNPINPFNILNSPGKARSITNGGFNPNSGTGLGGVERMGSGPTGSKDAVSLSPFIHASSPKKLKQVLEANSYHKTLVSGPVATAESNVSEGITPRTKARKRLRGEPVEDTPVKDRQTRRRRSHMAVSKSQSQSQSQSDSTRDVNFGKPIGGIFNGQNRDPMDEGGQGDEGGGDEDEEGLGPSPVKPLGGKTFTSLFDDEDMPPRSIVSAKTKSLGGKTDGKGKSGKEASQPGIMGFFGKLKKAKEKEKEKEKEMEKEKEKEKEKGAGISTTPSPTLDKSADNTLNSGTLSPASFKPDLDLPEPYASSSPRHQRRKDKVLSISEDEDDEWDPEGGKVQQKVVIVPTRRQVKRQTSTDGLSGLLDGVEEGMVDEEQDEDVGEEGDVIFENENGDTDGQTSHIPLDLLAITSPLKQRSAELESLRVSAIFNPFARKRLLALKRGQEIHTTGEAATGEEEGDAGGWEGPDNVLEGEGKRDDDWESEDEGWKKIEEGLDDW